MGRGGGDAAAVTGIDVEVVALVPGMNGQRGKGASVTVRDELQQLPAVGPSIAADLRRLGVRSVKDMARRDPERLYSRLCEITGQKQDPCVLYSFRCAVYAARTEKPDPELLNWWTWKNRRLPAR